jgi:hypothetical protein
MIPMTAAGEIEGVAMRDGGNAIEGLAFELVDAEGRVRATTLSEFDGYFLFESVAYGRYTVRVATASAAAVRVDAAFAVTAAPGRAVPRVRLGTLVLKPLRRALVDAAAAGGARVLPPGGGP